MHYPKEKVYCYYTIFFYSSSRTKSGSSRPHTGYGKTRTNAEDSQDQNSGMCIFFLVNKLYFHSSSYYFYIYIELSTLKNEDTNGESATPQRPGSAIKSARPRTGTYQSLLDNAPNYLVGFIIQKR